MGIHVTNVCALLAHSCVHLGDGKMVGATQHGDTQHKIKYCIVR